MFHDRLLALYRRHFREPRRERLFLASVAFFLTFAIARITVHVLGDWIPIAAGVWIGDTHVHHLVWGILILLGVGYAWLAQVGTGKDDRFAQTGRLMATLYGVGAALTLDEFALWLHLEDVYWEEEGRRSIDAVILFGGLVSMGLWGGPFLRAVVRQVTRLARRRAHPDPRAAALAALDDAAAPAGASQEARLATESASRFSRFEPDNRRSAIETSSSGPSASSGQ